MFRKKDDKPLTKKDIEKLREQAQERLKELEAQAEALEETPIIEAKEKAEVSESKPEEVEEPPKLEIPPDLKESLDYLFERYAPVVGNGMFPTDRDRITVMLLFAIWGELRNRKAPDKRA